MPPAAVSPAGVRRLREHEHNVRPSHVFEVVGRERPRRLDGVVVHLAVPLVILDQPPRIDDMTPRAKLIGVAIELIAATEPPGDVEPHRITPTVCPRTLPM